MRVAAVNWKLKPCACLDDLLAHFDELAMRCVTEGADLIVFPELFVLELLWDREVIVRKMPRDLAQWDEDLEGHFSDLAVKTGTTLVAGSHFAMEGGEPKNVSVVAFPDGSTRRQSKIVLTQFESAEWGLAAGDSLSVLGDPKFAVTICYDCEFPESGRVVAEAGCLLQCIPAFTETRRGFNRVRWSAHARAVENQIYVVHSSLVGSLGREPVPSAVGSSAVIAPCVEPFPESAILAETAWCEEGVAIADLDLDLLLAARDAGDVRNWNDRRPFNVRLDG